MLSNNIISKIDFNEVDEFPNGHNLTDMYDDTYSDTINLEFKLTITIVWSFLVLTGALGKFSHIKS